jgi:membrane fusion protein, multidrug efflux system
MRIVPMLTAILVSMALYFVVFERDTLLAFAKGEHSDEATQSAGSGESQSTVLASESTRLVGVVVLRSTAQTIDSAVILRGQTEAIRQVEVRAETTARVISEPLRKGAFVEADDIVCQLDPGTRTASLAEARARLAEAKSRMPEAMAKLDEAKARLKEAQINMNAAEKLIEGGYASETRLAASQASERSAVAGIATAEAGLETTRAGIEAAAAAVAAAEREIERLTIRAPFRGLLESDSAELGSLMQPGSLCATVIQLNPIKVTGYVPEAKVNRVTVGAIAGAELSTGLQVQGRVTFLGRSADPTTRTFLTEITVANDELLIRDGQTADIVIASDGALAHKIPQSALTLNNEGQLGVRIVTAGDIVAFVPVTLLRDDVDGVWLSGLPKAADVIVVGQDFVTAGVHVAPTFREATQ